MVEKMMTEALQEYNLTHDGSYNASRVSSHIDTAPAFEDSPSDTTYRIIFCYLVLVVVMGAGGNIAVIYTYIKSKNLHNPTNMLIVNLAASDVIVALAGTPLSVASTLQKRWLFGQIGCNVYGFINYYCGCISLNTLTMISIFRYLIIVRRKAKKFRRLQFNTIYTILGIHIYTTIFSTPPLFGWNRFRLEGFRIGCDVDFRTKTPLYMSYICYMFVFLFFVPLAIITWSYFKIYQVIHQHKKKSLRKPGSASSSSKGSKISSNDDSGRLSTPTASCQEFVGQKHRGKSRRRNPWLKQYVPIITILVTIVVFLLVWMPYCVVSLWTLFGDDATIPTVATVFANLFAKSCVIYNPMVYVILNPQFRRALISCCILRHCFPSSTIMNSRV